MKAYPDDIAPYKYGTNAGLAMEKVILESFTRRQ